MVRSASFSQSQPASLIIRHSVGEQVLAELRRQIIWREIAEGAPIPEAQFAESLGVSRVPVREALMQLERDGLLVTNERGKTVARTFTGKDYQEISAVRMELEGMSARLAATLRTQADLQLMEQNIAAFDAANGPEELARLDVEFHHLLVQTTRQIWLLSAWQTMRWPFEAILVRNFRSYVAATSLSESKSATADHGRILKALRKGDEGAAETLLRQHISRWEEWNPAA